MWRHEFERLPGVRERRGGGGFVVVVCFVFRLGGSCGQGCIFESGGLRVEEGVAKGLRVCGKEGERGEDWVKQ